MSGTVTAGEKGVYKMQRNVLHRRTMHEYPGRGWPSVRARRGRGNRDAVTAESLLPGVVPTAIHWYSYISLIFGTTVTVIYRKRLYGEVKDK